MDVLYYRLLRHLWFGSRILNMEEYTVLSKETILKAIENRNHLEPFNGQQLADTIFASGVSLTPFVTQAFNRSVEFGESIKNLNL